MPSPVLTAGHRPPDQPIQDWLHFRGLVYHHDKELLRAEALEAERQALTHRPALSARTEQLMGHDQRDVLQRMQQREREAEARIERSRTRQQQREASAPFRPSISKLAHKKHRKEQFDINNDWVAKRDRKVQAEREKSQRLLEKETVPPSPLSRRSRSLGKKASDARDGLTVEEWLLAADQQRRLRLRALVEGQGSLMRSPQITPMAASLQREGDITDRLFLMSLYKAGSELPDAIAEYDEEPEVSDQRPKVKMQLYGKQKERQARQAARQQQAADEEALLHRPQINAVSQELAATLPGSSKDRLWHQKRLHKRKDTRSLSPPFQPTLCPHSRELEEARDTQELAADGQFRHSRLELWEQYSRRQQDRLAALRRDQEAKALRECTFKPATTSPAPLAADPAGKECIGEVAERAQAWLQKREAKVRQQARAREEAEVHGCTFQPALLPASGPRVASLEAPSVADVMGFQSFMARTQLARQKAELERRPEPGSRWKPEITVPKEFRLSHQQTKGRTAPVVCEVLPSTASEQLVWEAPPPPRRNSAP
eukprot:EG_transcript_8932